MAKIVDAVSNMKQGSRSIRLRDAESPTEVNRIIQEVTQNAIVAQTGGNKRQQERAIRELRQIRQDVISGQVEAQGAQQKRIITKFSGLIDQMDQVDEETKQMTSATASVKENLPSSDTLISAMMTANPMIGYATKMARDLFKSQKERKSAQKQQQKKRLEVLEKQKEDIEKESQLTEEQAQFLDEEEKQDKKTSQAELLRQINSEIRQLRQQLATDSTMLRTPEQSETGEKLERLVEINKTSLEVDREQAQEQKLNRIQSERQDGDMAEAVEDAGDEESGGLGFLQGIMAGRFGGLIKGGLGAVLGGLTTVFGTIMTAGAGLARLAGKATGIGAVLMGIYEFVDGFLNAEDVLGRVDDINIGDKIMAGFANVADSFVTGIFHLFNWVADFFTAGDDPVFKPEEAGETIKNWILDSYDSFMDWLGEAIWNTAQFIKNFSFSDLVDDLSSMMTDFFDDIWEGMQDLFKGLIDDAMDSNLNPMNWFDNGDDQVRVRRGRGTKLIDIEDVKDSDTIVDDSGDVISLDEALSRSGNGSNSTTQSMEEAEENAGSGSGSGNANIVDASNRSTYQNQNNIVKGGMTTRNEEGTLRNATLQQNMAFLGQ